MTGMTGLPAPDARPVAAEGVAVPVAAGHVRLGVDLGGTKIEVVALDAAGHECVRRRVPTPAGDYRATLDAIAALVAEAESRLPPAHAAPRPIGIGIPGSVSPCTGLVRNANSTCLNGRPFAADIAARLGRPVHIENDANCLALSEAADGAAAGARTVFAAIVGTGVGGGLVVDGRLVGGASAIAGEWGHVRLPATDADELDAPACWCGRRGCIETWLSGPGLLADHARHGGPHLQRVEALLAARDAGDPLAIRSLDRWLDRLGRAFALVVNILDPDALVIGGGLSNLPDLDRLADAIRPHVFSDHWTIEPVRAQHGDSSGVRGAARLGGA